MPKAKKEGLVTLLMKSTYFFLRSMMGISKLGSVFSVMTLSFGSCFLHKVTALRPSTVAPLWTSARHLRQVLRQAVTASLVIICKHLN